MTSVTNRADDETRFCATLGRVIVAWNSVEDLFRLLLYKAVGGGGERIDALIANMGTVPMCDAISAVADAHGEPVRAHLKHCSKLFDAERLYRNHYMHDPIIFAHEDAEQKILIALTQNVTIHGGVLRLHQGTVTEAQLTAFLSRIRALNRYAGEVIAALYGVPNATLWSSIESPPLPDRLELKRMKVLEQRTRLGAR